MENPTLGIRCRIVVQIPTGIYRFDGSSHKIRSDPSRSGRRIKSPGSVILYWVDAKVSADFFSFLCFKFLLKQNTINQQRIYHCYL